MVRLWVAGTLCDVPADFQPEVTYRVTDAEGLETQCSSYSMSLDLPRTVTNMGVFTPLFDIQTLFGSASFDIHANVDAILEVNNRAERGYVKMESVDEGYHLRFFTSAGKLLEALRSMQLSDLSLGKIPFLLLGVQSSITKNYDAVYGSGNADEHFTYFPAFSDEDETYDTYVAGMNNGETVQGAFPYTYVDENGNTQTGRYSLTHHQARCYNVSGLRAAVQVKWLFAQILSQSGFTFDDTTTFFVDTNPYWKNLFMVLKQRTGDDENPVNLDAASFMPAMSCEDFILGYCKMFGLWIKVDGTKVSFLTRFEYYDITSLPSISANVDRKKGIAVKPNPYAADLYACGLQVEGTDDATYGRSFRDAVNLYDGVVFKYGEMMQYKGVRVLNWTTPSNYVVAGTIGQGGVTLPYITSTDGGELYFRFNNYNVGSPVRIYSDTLDTPYDGISAYGSAAYSSLPEITALNAAKPLYADRSEILYNYKYKIAVPAQQMFANDFAAYVAEISSKDNVELDCEGWFLPEQAEYLLSCRAIVRLDNVRCRVLECVTDGSGHCKLRLQKIDDPDNLIAGQGFSGYYLRSANYANAPLLAIPTTAQIGDVFPLPVETNDTITYAYLPTWLTNNGDGTVTLNTDPTTLPSTTTIGQIVGASLPRVSANQALTTAHAGSINCTYMVYDPANTIFIWPDQTFYVAYVTGPKTIIPAIFGKPDGAKCALFDNSGTPFSENAEIRASVDDNGALTIERKNTGAWAGMSLRVATYTVGYGGIRTYQAVTFQIDIASLQ